MDSYFFLHTQSLNGVDYGTYKSGLTTLTALSVEMFADERKIKHRAVYDNPLYMQMFDDYAETDGLIKFIEQCTLVESDIDNDTALETAYPQQDAGFMGINFSGITGVAAHRQVVDAASLFSCRNHFLERLIKYGSDRELQGLLIRRFPGFDFSKEAQNDILWWKNNQTKIIDTIIELLDDIPAHPFMGGLGKTEALSNTKTPVVSKRINKEDRLTYTVGEITTIHRCKEHYK